MPDNAREMVAVFDCAEALNEAVYTLQTRSFDRAAFALLASEQPVVQKLGHRYQRVNEVQDDPEIPGEIFLSRISQLEGEYLPAAAIATVASSSLAAWKQFCPP